MLILRINFIMTRKEAPMSTFTPNLFLRALRGPAPRAVILALGAAVAAAAGACDSDNTPSQKDGGSGGSGLGGAGGSGGSVATGTGGTSDGGTDGGAGGTTGTGGTDGGTTDGGGGADGGIVAITDTDMIAVRFNADGTTDNTFGTGGVARVDLGTGVGNVRDALWSVTRDATDRVLLFGGKKADGATRSDTDRAVVRLTANGAVDTTFATMGVHTLNIANLGDNARNGLVLADGKIITSGYTSQPTGVGNQTANRPVLLRLNDNGTPDTTFGAGGIVNFNPFMSGSPTVRWGFAEVYGVALQSTGKIVTTGYGQSDPAVTTVNLISLRFTTTGEFDTTYNSTGFLEKDVVGFNDRGRNLLALPDDRILMTGSSAPAADNVDAMVMLVKADGTLDTTFNTTGFKTYKFDDRPDEAFYGAALSPNNMFVAAVGYRAGGTGNNDDAVLLIMPLAGGAEVVRTVALSATTNDRFWGATFDASNKLLAAGFINEGGDNRMVVARFNTDGTPDTTFGTAGVVKVNASVAGTLEEARGVVVQSKGKIVVGGIAEHL